MNEHAWSVKSVVRDGRPGVVLAKEGKWTGWTEWTEWTYRGGGVEMEVRETARGEWRAVEGVIRNKSGAGMKLEKVIVVAGELEGAGEVFDRCFVQGPTMCEIAAVRALDGIQLESSHMVAGFSDQHGNRAVVIGFETHDTSLNSIEIERETGSGRVRVRVRAVVARDGVELAAGEELKLPVLLVGRGSSLQGLLGAYAEQVGRAMGARVARDGVMTGWCSWYGYYGTETAADVMANVRVLSQEPWKKYLRVIQIDDGWNYRAPDAPRNWGDWEAGYKFPQGMRAAAEEIKRQGFMPGLWLAPFSVEKASRVRQEHPDWLIQSEEGGPAEFWGVHGLDLTHPEALDFVYETFRRVFDEWGFEYVKIDFLAHGLQAGRRRNERKTKAEMFRDGVGRIRRAAGERFILNCGSVLGPAIGLCDAMRIGYDVSSRWQAMVNDQGWVVGNCAIKPAAVQTIGRQWMHGRLWQNDPDCVVVRDYGTAGEKKIFGEGAYGLTEEEAGLWVRLVWLSGNMTLLSEIMTELKGERLELLKRVFPVNDKAARVVDWYEQPDVHVLAGAGKVGIFNLGDKPVRMELELKRLGMREETRVREWLSGEEMQCEGKLVCGVPGHGGRVWIGEERT